MDIEELIERAEDWVEDHEGVVMTVTLLAVFLVALAAGTAVGLLVFG